MELVLIANIAMFCMQIQIGLVGNMFQLFTDRFYVKERKRHTNPKY